MSTLLTVTQAAERMGHKRAWAWRLIKDGRLEAMRVGSVWMVEEDALGRIKPPPRPQGRPRKQPKE